MEQKVVYFDATPWVNSHNQTLVIACSDPRFRKSTETFVERYLKIAHFDPLFLPGGPAAILLSNSSFFTARGQVQILHELHSFKRIIGIAHSLCGYYRKKYPYHSESEMYEQQWNDLQAFEKEIKRLVQEAEVEWYFADPRDGGVRFLA